MLGNHNDQNRFNGLLRSVETVETVPTFTRSHITQLKQGVNGDEASIHSANGGVVKVRTSLRRLLRFSGPGLGSEHSNRGDVERGQRVDVTVFAHHADFVRSNEDELWMRHIVFAAIRSANRKGSKSTTQLSPNLLNVHGCSVP